MLGKCWRGLGHTSRPAAVFSTVETDAIVAILTVFAR